MSNATGDDRTNAGYRDFEHTGPGTLAGRYLRMFWQPISQAQDLATGRAVPVRAMSEDLALYRGEAGTPHLLEFRCAHRGMQLSAGWVEGDCLRCFYHGWKYDGSGQCVEQPAEDTEFAKKIKLRSYPTREYLGLIFAYLGEGEPPEFPRYPEFEQFEGILELDSYSRACNYFNNLENCLDSVHVGFVHRDVQASAAGFHDIPVLSAEESQWGVTSYAKRPSGKQAVTQFGMPNMFHLKGLPNDPEIAGFREFLAWWVPVDDQQHTQFGVYAVRLSPDKARLYEERRDARRAVWRLPHEELAEAVLAGRLKPEDIDPTQTDIVRLQDDISQVGQGRVADRQHEHLGRSDVSLILIRKLWMRELQALAEGRQLKPWAYDPERLAVVREL